MSPFFCHSCRYLLGHRRSCDVSQSIGGLLTWQTTGWSTWNGSRWDSPTRFDFPMAEVGQKHCWGQLLHLYSSDSGTVSWWLTYTGTVRSNKPQIPREMKADSRHQEFISIFAFHDQLIRAKARKSSNWSVVDASRHNHQWRYKQTWNYSTL